MKKNVGGIDKGIRIGVGLALILVGLLAPLSTGWRIGVLVVAAIALITAFTGLCPLWTVLGISTRKEKGIRDYIRRHN